MWTNPKRIYESGLDCCGFFKNLLGAKGTFLCPRFFYLINVMFRVLSQKFKVTRLEFENMDSVVKSKTCFSRVGLRVHMSHDTFLFHISEIF